MAMTPPPHTNAVLPRAGLAGVWDYIVGPGASRGETFGTVSLMIIGGVAVPLSAALRGFHWTAWHYLLVTLMGIDLMGGVWANATVATRRWYHRPGQGPLQHLGFAALHLYPFLVAWAFRANDWGFALGNYGFLLGATLLVMIAPPRLQYPIATLLFAAILLVNMALWAPTPGVEWFIPIFFLKTLIGHAPALESAAL